MKCSSLKTKRWDESNDFVHPLNNQSNYVDLARWFDIFAKISQNGSELMPTKYICFCKILNPSFLSKLEGIMIIRLYDSMMTGNPVPEAKWVLRGRIVTNNTSPLYGNNENIQYVIHEKVECCSIWYGWESWHCYLLSQGLVLLVLTCWHWLCAGWRHLNV